MCCNYGKWTWEVRIVDRDQWTVDQHVNFFSYFNMQNKLNLQLKAEKEIIVTHCDFQTGRIYLVEMILFLLII